MHLRILNVLSLLGVSAVLVGLATGVPAALGSEAVSGSVADLVSKNQGKRQQAKEDLLVQGQKAIPQLIAALDDPDVEKKIAVMFILGQLKSTEAVPHLIEELKSENPSIRLSSAFALGLVGDSRALPYLVSLLDASKDTTAKGTALIALGYLKNKGALSRVRAGLADSDQFIRVTAAMALGMLGNQEGLQEAVEGTKSKDLTIPLVSVQALGLIGDMQALPRLNEMVRDPASSLRSEVLLAKKQIEYSSAQKDQKIEVLRGCMNDSSVKNVEWAIVTLAELGTAEAVSLLEEKARSGKGREAGFARLKLRMLER